MAERLSVRMARDEELAFEVARLEAHMDRRATLTTREKRLVFARRELAEHYAARDKWSASWARSPCDRTPSGALRWTNAADWQYRYRAWRIIIKSLGGELDDTAE